MTHKNFVEYTSFKTRVGIYMGFSKLKFPLVSICNTNPIRRSQINNTVSSKLRDFLARLNYTPSYYSNDYIFEWLDLFWDGNETLYEDYYMYDNDIGLGSNVKADPQYQAMEEFKSLYGGEDSNNKVALGHQLEDMLISCSYAGLQCGKEHFTVSQSNMFGNCFSFNNDVNNILTSRRTGNDNGLSLILYLENAEYIPGLTSGYGARLVIGQPGQMVLAEYNGLYLSAGAETDVGLRLINITRQGKPYGDCVSDSENRSGFSGFPSDNKYTRQNSLQETICKEASQSADCNDLTRSDMAEKRRNFMKVNVFYLDMNYEEIKEEPSYSFPSTTHPDFIHKAIGVCLIILIRLSGHVERRRDAVTFYSRTPRTLYS
ncbi:amiloride-sensitive sodium channel subunit gamma-2-like [Liolophura sinensis]|uniref:amiloride-sensitive sodium channel subunit gamma-2-like n=1 Tax=Liolophura sinensis TaxID=3198878 RepID=UPI0031598C55